MGVRLTFSSVALAAATLVLGYFSHTVWLIYASIGFSVLAAVGLGFSSRRRRRPKAPDDELTWPASLAEPAGQATRVARAGAVTTEPATAAVGTRPPRRRSAPAATATIDPPTEADTEALDFRQLARRDVRPLRSARAEWPPDDGDDVEAGEVDEAGDEDLVPAPLPPNPRLSRAPAQASLAPRRRPQPADLQSPAPVRPRRAVRDTVIGDASGNGTPVREPATAGRPRFAPPVSRQPAAAPRPAAPTLRQPAIPEPAARRPAPRLAVPAPRLAVPAPRPGPATPSSTPAAPARPVPVRRSAAPPEADYPFPIEDYAHLGVAEILPLLPELDDQELVEVLLFEQAGPNRASILNRIDSLLEGEE